MDRQGQKALLRYYQISQEEIAYKLKVTSRTIHSFYSKKNINENHMTNKAKYECINQIIKRKQWELKQKK